jgi:hypothetical protein
MDSTWAEQKPSRSKVIRIEIIIAVIALSVVCIFKITQSPQNAAPQATLVWLDPAEFAPKMRPGRLKMLYYKALNFTAPVWQRFRHPKTHILIASKVLAARGVTTTQLGVGAAIGTNDAGAHAWILSSSAMEDMRHRLKTLDGIDLVNAPTITVGDGTRASVLVGQSTPQTPTFVGMRVDVIPKIAAHQFQLAMSALYSEPNPGIEAGSVRTNLLVACRVMVPNGGGILITGPDPKDSNGTNYWLILSPTAIDGFGKPIRL